MRRTYDEPSSIHKARGDRVVMVPENTVVWFIFVVLLTV